MYDLWIKMSRAERAFSKYRDPRYTRENLRGQFVFYRKHFDKALRKAEREYNHKIVCDIEEVCTSNPRDFWSHIKILGPRKGNDVQLKVYNRNGQLVNNMDEVLGNWKHEFEILLNRPRDIGFDNTFYDECVQKKLEIEQENHDNPDLNAPISLQELEAFIGKLRCNKATSIDQIPRSSHQHYYPMYG